MHFYQMYKEKLSLLKVTSFQDPETTTLTKTQNPYLNLKKEKSSKTSAFQNNDS
jgi:hypothetical protein